MTQKTQTAGPFNNSESYDTRQRTGFNLWPSEIAELRDLCAEITGRGDSVGGVDMTGGPAVDNPLRGAVVNRAEDGVEPIGTWSGETIP